MNEVEVERQLAQMVKFIKQEAEEKANEIKVSAEEEFNIEKLNLLEQEKAKIRKEYERREAQVEVKKKIEFSKQLNEQRLKVLSAKEAAIQEVIIEAKQRLKDLTKNPEAYKKLLQNLLIQSMKKIQEKSVTVKCRQVDLILVKDVIPEARKSFAAKYDQDAPEVVVDTKDYLAPPPSDKDVASCYGGIVVVSADGRIKCSNTLDDRLKHSYLANLPYVRAELFGSK
uniref:Uncharacterized protein n=1 Tax=Polytomella parva TaxID=51329 RepID=A0A7S0YAU0_9CHLO|mmetsp:Transcript_14256/g.24921  ORF Transcript_14256/g.24921 Transcript_14256/m.24921 type:complete len:227 (+) Transcript_14256:98-778(+)|eukprot:CAMPEP_0175057792 /NCGR_PEP_ID=MMETSP0052_2-20121109/11464_1 /TAXON_ID=51329 ORGANISM="Polytomella parva, Strain SAG 63-3" /NCGR_SAMPLE_ID=MMETSP0052_2 /ASSEMBLY_ACC=CAM_ASM_000194 /LENGTH=226 /DNA_ID=CAMNT_0016323051 /DNA_START=89 /DNA_END=769 /DNA_ORIENTATION=+